jgi:hypothetical protein
MVVVGKAAALEKARGWRGGEAMGGEERERRSRW